MQTLNTPTMCSYSARLKVSEKLPDREVPSLQGGGGRGAGGSVRPGGSKVHELMRQTARQGGAQPAGGGGGQGGGCRGAGGSVRPGGSKVH
jgi:hypothetical protein